MKRKCKAAALLVGAAVLTGTVLPAYALWEAPQPLLEEDFESLDLSAAQAQPVRYEAEDAKLENGAGPLERGTFSYGYSSGANNTNSMAANFGGNNAAQARAKMTYTVYAQAAGKYLMRVKYQSGERMTGSFTLYINGTPERRIHFPKTVLNTTNTDNTALWDHNQPMKDQYIELELQEGVNTIMLSPVNDPASFDNTSLHLAPENVGYTNYDFIEILPTADETFQPETPAFSVGTETELAAVNVPVTGLYAVDFAYHTDAADAAFTLEANGAGQGTVALEKTANEWSVARTYVPLQKGNNTLHLQGASGSFTLDRIRVHGADTRYEAEDAALLNTSSSVADDQPKAVAAQPGKEYYNSGGGYVSGMSRAGGTMTFMVDAVETGSYRLALGFCNMDAEAVYRLKVDGEELSQETLVVRTLKAGEEDLWGDWIKWSNHTKEIQLTRGRHEITVEYASGGDVWFDYLDLDYMEPAAGFWATPEFGGGSFAAQADSLSASGSGAGLDRIFLKQYNTSAEKGRKDTNINLHLYLENAARGVTLAQQQDSAGKYLHLEGDGPAGLLWSFGNRNRASKPMLVRDMPVKPTGTLVMEADVKVDGAGSIKLVADANTKFGFDSGQYDTTSAGLAAGKMDITTPWDFRLLGGVIPFAKISADGVEMTGGGSTQAQAGDWNRIRLVVDTDNGTLRVGAVSASRWALRDGTDTWATADGQTPYAEYSLSGGIKNIGFLLEGTGQDVSIDNVKCYESLGEIRPSITAGSEKTTCLTMADVKAAAANGQEVRLGGTYTNRTGEEKQAALLIGLYKADGTLLALSGGQQEALAEGAGALALETDVGALLENAPDAAQIRVFTWDAMTGRAPLELLREWQ